MARMGQRHHHDCRVCHPRDGAGRPALHQPLRRETADARLDRDQAVQEPARPAVPLPGCAPAYRSCDSAPACASDNACPSRLLLEAAAVLAAPATFGCCSLHHVAKSTSLRHDFTNGSFTDHFSSGSCRVQSLLWKTQKSRMRSHRRAKVRVCHVTRWIQRTREKILRARRHATRSYL